MKKRSSIVIPKIMGNNSNDEDIAIIGMSCRFPGANNYNEFWENLKNCICSIKEVPSNRWNPENYKVMNYKTKDEVVNKWMGSIEGIENFDADFFNISYREAACMDPQQKIALELAWNCFEDAGITISTLQDRNVGVYVADFIHDFEALASNEKPEPHYATGVANNMIANRISYTFDIEGPSFSIDSACAGSLHAIHVACQSIKNRECSMALAGGIQVISSPVGTRYFSQMGMISPNGLCKTFDEGADGYVRAEGGGFILLKPLKKALADHDDIYAIIKGSALNHCGKGKTITYPNPDAQAKAIINAVKNSGVAPSKISYIETHGTGTPKGDPIEIDGLKKAFQNLIADVNYKTGDFIGLGSVKTNVGHLEAAAGMASVIKVILAMKHHTLPGLVHFQELNHRIDLSDSPFYIVDKTKDWVSNSPLYAGISGFGFGGSNAHIILEESMNESKLLEDKRKHLICLSAKTQEALWERISALKAYIRSTSATISQIEETLMFGREHFKIRVAFIAEDIDDLFGELNHIKDINGVNELIQNAKVIDNINPIETYEFFKQKDYVENSLFTTMLNNLKDLYIQGKSIEFNNLFHNKSKKIHLPGYSFAKTKFPILKHDIQKDLNESGTETITRQHNRYINSEQSFTHRYFTYKLENVSSDNVQMDDIITIAVYDKDSLAKSMELLQSGKLSTNILIKLTDNLNENKENAYKEDILAAFSLVKALIDREYSKKRLNIIFESSNASLDMRTSAQPYTAAFIGFVGTLAKEYPFWNVLLVDTDHSLNTSDCMICNPKKYGNVIFVRNGEIFSRTLKEAEILNNDETISSFVRNGVYVILGGSGGIGLKVSKYLRKEYDAQIVWIGRSEREKIQEKLDELDTYGSKITYIRADVTKYDELLSAYKEIKSKFSKVNGVIHSVAGPLDESIANLSAENFDKIISAKIDSAVNLSNVFAEDALDFILYFSSVASWQKFAGQCGYTAGCSFIDEYGKYLDQIRSYPVRVINWGLWRETGIAKKMPQSTVHKLLASGLNDLDCDLSLKALEKIIKNEEAEMFFLNVADDFVKDSTSSILKQEKDAETVLGNQDYKSALKKEIVQIFAEAFCINEEKIKTDENLDIYGLDSVITINVTNVLTSIFDGLSGTLLYERTTIDGIADYIWENYEETVKDRYTSSPKHIADNTEDIGNIAEHVPELKGNNNTQWDYDDRNMKIAVIGMSGKFPGADNTNEFWNNLVEGKDSITEIPSDRWCMEGFYEKDKITAAECGMSYCKWGGFIDNPYEFDAEYFRISPKDAINMDPHERLFLQESIKTFEDAGYTKEDISKKYDGDVGVFAGVTRTGYEWYGSEVDNKYSGIRPITSFGSVANRVSYFMNLHGPSMPVDTMCSSSLVAVHLACESLRNRECKMALAGGVNVYTHPSSYTYLSSMMMLSPTGKCHSFGENADGFVPGEGVGAILLKPLKDAINDGDSIYGVILSSSMNHNGRTNGYTVPNPNYQAALISQALNKAKVSARTLSYMEAHGTGTKLGDPIEVAGLSMAFAKDTKDKGFCKLGSVKSNIGHLEAAAGISGVIKTLLQMKNKTLVKTINCEEKNSRIDFEHSPLILCESTQEWEKGEGYPRRAGVSSFGAGGTNAFVLLEEYENACEKRHPLHITEFKNTEYSIKKYLKNDNVMSSYASCSVPDVETSNTCWESEGELDLYEEVWEEADAQKIQINKNKNYLICSKDINLLTTIKKCSEKMYPNCSWSMVLLDEKESYDSLLSKYKGSSQKNYSIIELCALEPVTYDDKCKRLFDLIQAVDKYELNVNMIGVVGEFSNIEQRCEAESFIAVTKSIKLVLPETDFRVILSDKNIQGEVSYQQIVSEIVRDTKTSVFFDGAIRKINKLKKLEITKTNDSLERNGVYLITGGSGKIAGFLAEMLRRQYDAEVFLASRHIENINCFDKKVHPICMDVCNKYQIEEGIKQILDKCQRLDGIFHAGGVSGDKNILNMEYSEFQKILSPKVSGTKFLEEAIRNYRIKFICYFSSIATVVGDTGSIAYSIGNRYMDCFAKNQKTNGIKRFVVNWPLWKEGGMHIHNGNDEKYYRATNQTGLITSDGLAVLRQVLQGDKSQCILFSNKKEMVHPIIKQLMKEQRETGMSEFVNNKYNQISDCSDNNAQWFLKQKVVNEIDNIIIDLVCMDKEKINHNQDFEMYGFDSIILAKFAARISKKFSIKYTPDLFFSFSNVNAVAGYLCESYQAEVMEMVKSETPLPALNETTEENNSAVKVQSDQADKKECEVAIVGMSGRFPDSRNVEELWKHICNGEDVTTNVVKQRESWKQGLTQEELSDENFGKIGAIPGIAEFDPLFFEISPKDAKLIDPKQRIFVEEAMKAIEDAGIGKSAIKEHKIGMFVGVEDGDYQTLLSDNTNILASHNAVLAARLAYLLDFKGPNIAINTACSSGLVAVHEAIMSIKNGECDIAVAAGISVMSTNKSYRGMKKAGMLSASGKCNAFDKKADGMIPAEAVAVIVLMREDIASENGYGIYALIKGSEISFDGRTNGITAPSGEAQADLLRKSYTRNGVDPEKITYIIAHGTGTKLGDPIEINALNKAFSSLTDKKNYCAVTSIKPNIGHALAASGVINLIALTMAIRDKVIPGSIHCNEMNDYIDWNNTPFYLNKVKKNWDTSDGVRRLGGVSAFGMSGTNVHIILEEPESRGNSAENQQSCYLLVFSAKSKKSLKDQLVNLAEYIRLDNGKHNMRDISYTLFAGRMHYANRCAVVVSGQDHTPEILLKASNEISDRHVFTGIIPDNFEKDIFEERKVMEYAKTAGYGDENQCFEKYGLLAQYYCKGYEDGLNDMFECDNPVLLHLPTYSFDNKEYWIAENVNTIQTSYLPERKNNSNETVNHNLSVRKEDILNIISEVVQINKEDIQVTNELSDYGLGLVEYSDVAEKINCEFGTSITGDDFFIHSSIDKMAEYLSRNKEECSGTEKETIASCGLDAESDSAEKVGLSDDVLEDIILYETKETLAMIIEMELNEIEEEKSFSLYGLDSIGIVELSGALSEQFGVPITPDVLFNHSSAYELTKYLISSYKEKIYVFAEQKSRPENVSQTKNAGSKSEDVTGNENVNVNVGKCNTNQDADIQKNLLYEEIAVTGMSGRFPNAKNTDELWDILKNGINCVDAVSADRAEWNKDSNAKNRKIGQIQDIDKFDPLFFEISPIEAERMDPRQRILMQEIWHALEDSGYNKNSLNNNKVGIFVGAEDGEYKNYTDDELIVSNHNAVLASRIAYLLDFKGPNMVINTACSSGLVAFHEACQSLRLGECDIAVVAACNILITPNSYDTMVKNGMISPSGVCSAFDESADGMVPSEAVAAVILKRLSDAKNSKDNIYALIEASGINYDGKTNGITAPNGDAQAELMQSIYEKFNIDPENISYVVTHGTGTKLGDPIEFNALNQTYRKFTDKTGYCAVTSTKSNLGHSMAASGLVSLISLILAIKNEMIPASINFKNPNPYCGWKDSPFYVNVQNKEWKDKDGEARFAAVSAFGLSGTNAHVVVKSYKEEEETSDNTEPRLFVFSAKSKKSLKDNIKNIWELDREFLNKYFAAISYTLLNRRTHFEFRLAIVASNVNDLLSKCKEAIEDFHAQGVQFNRCLIKQKVDKLKLLEVQKDVERYRKEENDWAKEKLLVNIGKAYSEGFDEACKDIFSNVKYTPVKLPLYAFDEEHYWLNVKLEEESTSENVMDSTDEVYPDVTDNKLVTTFTSDDYILHDHVIGGNSILPGAEYIEIARSAITYLAGFDSQLIIRNVGFFNPAKLTQDEMQISTSLKIGLDNEVLFQIFDSTQDNSQLCCSGSGFPIESMDVPRIDLEALKRECTNSITPSEFYEKYKRIGMNFGKKFNTLVQMKHSQDVVIAQLCSNVPRQEWKESYIYPDMLDGAFQSTMGFFVNDFNYTNAMVPFAIGEIRILKPCKNNMWAVARFNGKLDDCYKFDIVLCDESGDVCITIIDYTSKAYSAENQARQNKVSVRENQEVLMDDTVSQYGSSETEVFKSSLIEQEETEQREAIKNRVVLGYNCDDVLVQFELENDSVECEPILIDITKTAEERYMKVAMGVFEYIKTLFEKKIKEKTLLQLIFREKPENTELAGISALLKVASKENPNLITQLICLDTSVTADDAYEFIMKESGSSSFVLYKDNKRYVKVWNKESAGNDGRLQVKDGGKYVITGGLGGLGRMLVKWILESTQNVKLLLIGRKKSQLDDSILSLASEANAIIECKQADITVEYELKNVISQFTSKYGDITGIFHCAGIIKDNYILKKAKQEFLEVLEPKVLGLSNLDRVCSEEKLDFLICYSSTSGCVGGEGQCDYSVGNAFMNEYMRKRQTLVAKGERRGKSLAICWPLWNDGGMQVQDTVKQYMFDHAGILPLSEEDGRNALAACMNLDTYEALVLKGNKEQYKKIFDIK